MFCGVRLPSVIEPFLFDRKSVVGDPAQLIVDDFRPKVALLCAMNVFVSALSTIICCKKDIFYQQTARGEKL